jgi:Rrf2 family transcriptional regulator, iron-sulfur cluster assembly transcription factor
MMLTTKSRYAVMAILEVASSGSTKPMRLSDISEKQTIPLSYLEQIFLKLKKSHIVKSVKGPGGGYCLNSASELLNIIEIIDAVEENTKMTRCSVDKTCRKNGAKCMTHDLWKGLGNQIRNYFSSISVADVMSGKIDFHMVKE